MGPEGRLSALDEAQIPYDRKKFVPHVTIIRNMGGPWKKVSLPKAGLQAYRDRDRRVTL